jgi:hypothetical protein
MMFDPYLNIIRILENLISYSNKKPISIYFNIYHMSLKPCPVCGGSGGWGCVQHKFPITILLRIALNGEPVRNVEVQEKEGVRGIMVPVKYENK